MMRIIQALSIVLLGCVAAAIVVQDYTSVLPLGLFNTGARYMTVLSTVCLVLAIVGLGILLGELRVQRLCRPAGLIRGVLVAVIILEGLLLLADKTVVGGGPRSPLGGLYYERQLSDGTPVILSKESNAGSRAFCTGTPGEAGGGRVLFLGDSYTVGSGRSEACNYPDVVESRLRARWRHDARVMNAGVSGYGPIEALRLLRWYRERGCTFDAVVYNLFLENDVTDNLPGTERRVVAGHIYRFPRSNFLRTFHPLNSRTFRWALYIVHTVRITRNLWTVIALESGPCDTREEPLTEVSAYLREAVHRRLDGSQRVAASPAARRELLATISTMHELAGRMGVPFVLVVFPDRALVDPDLQRRLELGPGALHASGELRAFVAGSLGDTRIVDVTETLDGRTGLYRRSDTHLSDRGNVVAGEYVGNRLAGLLLDQGGEQGSR